MDHEIPQWLRDAQDTVTVYEGRQLFGEVVLVVVPRKERDGHD